ncbi:unnamed protein product, partial [Arabidopsis halleri]
LNLLGFDLNPVKWREIVFLYFLYLQLYSINEILYLYDYNII